MKKFLIIFFALLPILAANGSPKDVSECPALKDINTLPEIIEIGLCKNPITRIGYLSMEAARLGKNQAYAAYLPRVNGNMSMGASSFDNFDMWSSGASVSATYLIFDFGRRFSELSRMAAIWKATGFDYEDTVQTYIYGLIAAYYGLLIADAELKADHKLLAAAKEAKDMADRKFSAGTIARVEVLRADTTLAMRQTDLERSIGNREVAHARLLAQISMPQGLDIKIADMPSTFGDASEIENVHGLIQTANKKRPDLLSATAQVNANWHARNIAFQRFLPTISATGSINYNIDNNIREDRIGISASMPLFMGFENIYGARMAMMNYERAEQAERRAADLAHLDVWTAFNNYKVAIEVLKATNALLASAAETERVVSGMFRVGRSTMLDWQMAQADWASAERQNAAARYDLFIKRAALAMSIGVLKAEDVK